MLTAKAQDCVWVSRLQRLGYHKQDIVDAIADLKVRYSPGELQRWASGYDVVAVQEADPLFCEALGTLSLRMVRGRNDLDGRGVQVESCSALILRNAECVCQQSAVLSFKPNRRVTVSREHFVVRVERQNDGEQLVICSVHFHVPSMISRSRITLADYLQPLRAALESVAGQGADGRLQVPCLLLGDFNMDPSMFKQLSHDDPFWKQCSGWQWQDGSFGTLPVDCRPMLHPCPCRIIACSAIEVSVHRSGGWCDCALLESEYAG